MEKISQERKMTGPRTDADPLRVVAAHRDSHSECSRDAFDLKTTTSELQILVHQLERWLKGRKPDRLRYRLSPQDFTKLTGEYEEKLSLETVRYDYYSDTHEFVLLMPTLKHEVVHIGLSRLLLEKTDHLCDTHSVGRPVEPAGRTDIESEQGDVFQPDEQIWCRTAERPGLVLLVGSSHEVKELRRKAFRIIQAGKGQIRLVVTVKLLQDSRVDLTVWRPSLTSDDPPKLTAKHVNQGMRNTNGELVPGAQLEIPMAELAPPKSLPDSLRSETIIITAEELCGIVKHAEDLEKHREDLDKGKVAEELYEDFPTDIECASSPASSFFDFDRAE
ncbi:hypothetical protein A1O3_06147 [Capronia epimyces CBS 606.96]|uniref:Uncharacterized protein n=1 Tax=Capronia epimyces CBS 606.96 TaxID=1182542 RepID=W9YJB2_9EURO|nr:uncharacterized protein A1O3_06147 [Capronia epimyces CBS 606.96]EXJ82334.1 hypothetical protein A1O3_06147 [Capronia epimyces CBS 606.96]